MEIVLDHLALNHFNNRKKSFLMYTYQASTQALSFGNTGLSSKYFKFFYKEKSMHNHYDSGHDDDDNDEDDVDGDDDDNHDDDDDGGDDGDKDDIDDDGDDDNVPTTFKIICFL